MKDLIIIGAGPAGITASVYAARKKLDFLVITREVGGQAAASWEVENYTGYQFVTGPELVEKFKEHLEHFKIQINEGETATLVQKESGQVVIETDKGTYRSRTVLIASGTVAKKLGIEGEEEFRNRGVTYCATCDGPLFADKKIAVIGGGNAGLETVLQMMKLATKIYLIELKPELPADAIMVDKARASDKVEVLTNTRTEKIFGNDFVKGISIRRGEKLEELAVEGVFVEIGWRAASRFVQGVRKNKQDEIIVDCACRTSVEGVYAAGDVTNVYGKQIIIACGEGAKASMAAFEYLSRRK